MKWFRPAHFTPGIHIFIWALLLGIPSVLFRGQHFLGLTQAFFLLSSLSHIAFFYFNAYFLYPKLLTRRRWPLYIVTLAASVYFLYEVKLFLLNLQPGFQLTNNNGKVIFFGIFPFLIGSIIFRLVRDRIWFERKEKEARAERLAAELKFLRSQVSPHFLFNMLTNLVSLARQKSDLLEPSLIRLSELLRYMLYDSGGDRIPVSREIEQLENYVALQQLRFGEDVRVSLSVEDNGQECLLEPMLLVPFIENAFKHGIGMLDDPYISISVATKEKVLRFSVENNYNGANFSKDTDSGIGLANVKNRLKLLYGDRYTLTITDANGVFSVHLNLDLS